MIDFDEMIANYLKRVSTPKQAGRYYPSQIGSCMRKSWYSYKIPVETSIELIKVFEVGNMLHDFVVRVLQSEKNPHVELLKTEFPFYQEIEDFAISGRLDDLILVKSDNRKILLEVKSTSNIDFVKEPIASNTMQLQLYLHFFGIDDGMLLYIDKRDMRSKIFELKYNVDEALAIIERFKQLHRHIITDNLPDPEARAVHVTQWLCKRCEYKEKCYDDTRPDEKWL